MIRLIPMKQAPLWWALGAAAAAWAAPGTAAGSKPDAPPHAMADLRRLADDAVRNGASRVVIPPGLYRGEPAAGQAVHLDLDGVDELDIVADGVTMVCTRRTRAIQMTGCRNVTLRGLTIDYDPPAFTQGDVVEIAEDKSSILVRIDAGYPWEAWSRIDVVDPATRYRMKGMPFLWGTKAERVPPDGVRVSLAGIGNVATIGTRVSLSTGNEPGGICHGITLERCRGGMALRNVTLHGAPGMGIVESGGVGGTVLDGVRIVPGPKPAGATEERLLSTSWDGILHSAVGRGPLVENCTIESCGDDSWSVQSSDYLVLRAESNTVVLGTRSDSFPLQAGDRLRWSNDSPDWTIASIRIVDRAGAGLASNVIEKMRTAEPWTLWKIHDRAFARLTLDRPASFNAGQSLYCPDRQGNGFVFRNNRVHSPGRLLIKAGDGRIENNLLLAPHSVVLCPEAPGEAAVGLRNLVIRGNTIVESGYFCPAPWSEQAGAICLAAAAPDGKLRPPGVFDKVDITDNTFRGVNGVNLVIASARRVRIAGNRFIDTHRAETPRTGERYGIDQSAVIWVARSQDVEFTGNEVLGRGPRAGRTVVVEPSASNVTGTDTIRTTPAPDAPPEPPDADTPAD